MGAVLALAALIACGAGEDLVDEASAAVGDPAKLDAVLARARDDVEHDLLVERLAVRHHDKASALCPRMRTPQGKDKCAKVLGRPHLAGPPK
ncbi:MAG: hypothetical protein ACOZNI_14450 [Myxococcota bacterium]